MLTIGRHLTIIMLLLHPSFQFSLHRDNKRLLLWPQPSTISGDNDQSLNWFDTPPVTADNSLETPIEMLELNAIAASVVGNQLMENNKRDLFTSRGWGPGGTPYKGQYYNEFSYANLNRKQTERDDPVALALSNRINANDDSINLNKHPQSSGREEEKGTNDEQARRLIEEKKKYKPHIIPQFFLSYGWGPNGEK